MKRVGDILVPVEFLASTWRTAAENRCAKRILKDPEETDLAYVQLAKDLRAIAGLEKLLDWTTAHNVSVGFEPDGDIALYPDIRYVKMSSRARPERQLYLLLHECGHFLIGSNRSPSERFGKGYSMMRAAHPSFLRSAVHRIDVLDEELEAWARGRKLAKKLRIAVDPNVWEKVRIECIKTYIKWACKAGGYTGLRPGDD